MVHLSANENDPAEMGELREQGLEGAERWWDVEVQVVG